MRSMQHFGKPLIKPWLIIETDLIPELPGFFYMLVLAKLAGFKLAT